MIRLAIVSDVHYAGAAERERHDYPYAGIRHPLRRFLTRQFRYWIWQRDPFAHNHLLARFIEANSDADMVVANGDYSCDSMGIGVSDQPACASAEECLGNLRRAFGERFHSVIGDHELGKMMMSAERGGLRLASLEKATAGLKLRPFWRVDLGRVVLLGITSTIAALPVYEAETLPDEREEWRRLHEDHLAEIGEAFVILRPDQRVLLFCHDPSALPFLWQQVEIREKLGQLERTVIGHLHTQLVFGLSRYLSGMPQINCLGHTPRRLSRALRQARFWAPFKPLLCPSPAGTQLLKDGGYFTARIDDTGNAATVFEFHPLSWETKQG